MKLEIGPGKRRQPGFTTVDVDPAADVDHVCDAVDRLPFEDGTFELVFASHILEHIPWYQSELALAEWARVLAPGGVLEVRVPNGLKIAKAFVAAEEGGLGKAQYKDDGWWRLNEGKDPCRWAAGRTFTYGDGKGELNHPNWHRALFSPRYLQLLLKKAGLKDVRMLKLPQERRGPSHGFIDMGARGTKT
jgi:SAM-dependent methyltransferase